MSARASNTQKTQTADAIRGPPRNPNEDAGPDRLSAHAGVPEDGVGETACSLGESPPSVDSTGCWESDIVAKPYRETV